MPGHGDVILCASSDPGWAFAFLDCPAHAAPIVRKHLQITAVTAAAERDIDSNTFVGAIAMSSHGHWAPWGQLAEAIRTGEPRAEATLGSSIFDYYASPAGAADWDTFSQLLAGILVAVSKEAIRLIDTRKVSLAVDVGGASWSLVHALMKVNPALRGIVLDLPHVVPRRQNRLRRSAWVTGSRSSLVIFATPCHRPTFTCSNTCCTTGRTPLATQSCRTVAAVCVPAAV